MPKSPWRKEMDILWCRKGSAFGHPLAMSICTYKKLLFLRIGLRAHAVLASMGPCRSCLDCKFLRVSYSEGGLEHIDPWTPPGNSLLVGKYVHTPHSGHTHIYKYIYIYTCMYVCMYIYMYIYIYYTYKEIHICMYAQTHTHIYICMCIYTYVCAYVDIVREVGPALGYVGNPSAILIHIPSRSPTWRRKVCRPSGRQRAWRSSTKLGKTRDRPEMDS